MTECNTARKGSVASNEAHNHNESISPSKSAQPPLDSTLNPLRPLASGAQLPYFSDANTMYHAMKTLVCENSVTNYLAVLSLSAPDAHIITTPLFPIEVLEAYTAKNLGYTLSNTQQSYLNAKRGGAQGDYSQQMGKKIDTVIQCLSDRPESKRAYLYVPNTTLADPTCDEDAKCLQLIHFTLSNSQLNTTVTFRAQAVEIFPKNIHFLGELITLIAKALGEQIERGNMVYHAVQLISTREG